MTAHTPQVGGIEAIRPRELRQPLPQPRPGMTPAADAKVQVITLREEPAIAAGYDTEVKAEDLLPLGGKALGGGKVPLQPHQRAARDGHSGERRRPPIGPIGSDERARAEPLTPSPHTNTPGVPLNRTDRHPFLEGRASGDRPLSEECIESPALGQIGQRLGGVAAVSPALAQRKMNTVDRALGHRSQVERDESRRAHVDPAAARLISRELRPVEQERREPAHRTFTCRSAAGRPGADHDDIMSHTATHLTQGRSASTSPGIVYASPPFRPGVRFDAA